MRKILFSLSLCLSLVSGIAFAELPKGLLANEKDTIEVFEMISPLVVNVHNLRTFNSHYQTRDVQAGMGSGFLWNKQGYVVTNFHVIQRANKVMVTLHKGVTVAADVVAVVPRKDIAVLKLQDPRELEDLKTFKVFPVADSSKLRVGQKAIAIGNPFGLERTLTTGVVSAVGREIPGVAGVKIRNMIQTDASINPGNSGGPLLDSQGRLIGMNTMIFSKSGTSSGIGFALPSNDVKRVVNQLIKYGRVKRAGIGVQLFGDHVADELGIDGVIINVVAPKSPAKKAGLKGTYRDKSGQIVFGDIITEIDGKPVNSYEELLEILEEKGVGDEVTLTIDRDGEMKKVKVKTMDVNE